MCYGVGSARTAALREAEGRARVLDMLAMTQTLRIRRAANRIDENSVAAHHFRGAALAELGHIEEARTAYARALALDPDDPEVLRSVADLHVRRLGSRDDLELALQYVRRALPRAQRGKDKPLLKEHFLPQPMPLHDLACGRHTYLSSGMLSPRCARRSP